MATEVLCALISGAVTLTVAMGTWYFTSKKDGAENKKLVLNKIDELKDDITNVNATVQQQMALQTLEITHLRTQVEKHNGVIERMFKLEQKVEDLEKIS